MAAKQIHCRDLGVVGADVEHIAPAHQRRHRIHASRASCIHLVQNTRRRWVGHIHNGQTSITISHSHQILATAIVGIGADDALRIARRVDLGQERGVLAARCIKESEARFPIGDDDQLIIYADVQRSAGCVGGCDDAWLHE